MKALFALYYHRRILFTDFFSQSRKMERKISENREILERQLGESLNLFQISGIRPSSDLYHEYHRGI